MLTVQNKLSEWKRELLDVRKSNRLLFFKETKRQTLHIQLPEPEVVFERIALSEKQLEVVGLDQDAMLNLNTMITDESRVEPHITTVKAGEILFSDSIKKVATSLYELRSISRTALEERGIGVLYLAFGFLHWFEAEMSDIETISPLILVPVDLQRETAVKPYHILSRDDDIVINPTLCKVLEDQFKIKLPELPDAETWSIIDYLSDARTAISGHSRWSVEDTVFLSAFSFQKLNMYRDLELGNSVAQDSAIIQALAGDLSSLAAAQGDIKEVPANELDTRVDPAECLQVLDADSSQQQAIELAKAGASFVLQGPPGTGKSQTIANIIAELLGQGRTILFVSEKAAALDVVYRRLTSVGLADECLALHSQRANKRDVVTELARVYSLGNNSSPENSAFNYSQLRERRLVLNQYVQELHLRRDPLHKSVFEVEGLVAQLDDAPQIPFEVSSITQITAERIESMKDAAARLSGSSEAIVSLDENPWRESSLDGQSLEIQRITDSRLSEAYNEYVCACSAGNDLAEALGLKSFELTPSNIEWMIQIAKTLIENQNFMGTWLLKEKLSELIDLANVASEQYFKAASENEIVGLVFTDAVMKYDLDGLLSRIRGQYHSIFSRFGKAYRQEIKALAVFTKTGKKPSFAQLLRTIPNAIALRDRRRWIDEHESQLHEEFDFWFTGHTTEWSSLKAALNAAKLVSAYFQDNPPQTFILHISNILSTRNSLLTLHQVASKALSSTRKTALEINGWFEENAPSKSLFSLFEKTSLNVAAHKILNLRSAIDGLIAWTRLSRACQECKDSGMGDPIALLKATSIQKDQYVNALVLRIYTLWLDYWIGTVAILRDFDTASQEYLIKDFRRLDLELKLVARRTLILRLAEQRPNPSAASINLASSQPALLMKEAKKKRRHKPLRRLFVEISDLLIKLKPCMMMSPLSVSQFLPLESIKFDTVVFDEASQVKPADAIGAIMRGKQAIVVGDSKQLPPTAFFDVSMADDFDEDDYYEDEAGAFESILDVFGTIGLPERWLQWHYRSRCEGLIAFSNNFLYDNRLVTFPSSKFDGLNTGVEFTFIDGGIYDRSHSRTNSREVQEVLKIVRSHALTNPKKSLGVVAFSQAQMTAIDTALWRLRSSEPRLETFFSNMHDEPFFVKNLENVQGDERDVIIFSVGYGRDATGKLAMNFGPLNKVGGERRLNVAVTRAREKVILVSSIRGADIDVTRTQALGVHLLKHYLDYAEHGVEALNAVCAADSKAEFDSAFEEQVARILESKGYRIERQVGCSGYRIDLAVVHPSRPGQYALGIECDGSTYHSAATARERDRLREQILNQLGWKIYRIWSTDWFKEKSKEIQKLVATVEAAISEPEKTTPRLAFDDSISKSEHPVFAIHSEKIEQKPIKSDYLLNIASSFAEYQPERQYSDFYTARIAVKNILVETVNSEGPISLLIAVRRVASAWGISRCANRVQATVILAVKSAVHEGLLIERGRFLYSTKESKIKVRRNFESDTGRKAKDIAPEEISEAARLVLKDQIKLTTDDLIVATARIFGFDRVGIDVNSAMLDGIKCLLASGVAKEEEGSIYLV